MNDAHFQPLFAADFRALMYVHEADFYHHELAVAYPDVASVVWLIRKGVGNPAIREQILDAALMLQRTPPAGLVLVTTEFLEGARDYGESLVEFAKRELVRAARPVSTKEGQ